MGISTRGGEGLVGCHEPGQAAAGLSGNDRRLGVCTQRVRKSLRVPRALDETTQAQVLLDDDI